MTDIDFDVLVVGGGRAGIAAAYKLAEQGRSVALLERAKQPGMKNVTGGVLYGKPLLDLVPEFPEEAPLERHVVEHNIFILTEGSRMGLTYRDTDLKDEPNYTVILGKFDRWFVQRAEEMGVTFLPETTVTDVNQHKDYVSIQTDRRNGALTANAVIGADGVNTTVGKQSGIQRPMRNSDMKLSVKKVIDVDEDVLRERFRVEGSDGVAYAFAGFPPGLRNTGYFLYTYQDKLSVGAVGDLNELREYGTSGYQGSGTPLYSLLEEFLQLDAIRPLVRGDSVEEYQGILIPSNSYGSLPDRQRGRVVLVGDAAGLVLNKGFTFRGLDYGIKSGLLAAEAAIMCDENGNWDQFGPIYDKRLKDSYVLQELKQHRRLPSLLKRARLYDEYPGIARLTLKSMFSSTADGQGLTWRQGLRAFRQSDVTVREVLSDGWKALRSF